MSREVIYAFIDSQNLNLGTSKDVVRNGKTIYHGWKLDFKKFYSYLINKFKVSKAFIFIGFIEENKKLYDMLTECGYTLIFKPVVKDSDGKAKGNVDTEIVLYSCTKIHEYDKAIFTSGDGDFMCLYDYLSAKNKLKRVIIPNQFSESKLLIKYQSLKTFLSHEKQKLILKPSKKKKVSKKLLIQKK